MRVCECLSERKRACVGVSVSLSLSFLTFCVSLSLFLSPLSVFSLSLSLCLSRLCALFVSLLRRADWSMQANLDYAESLALDPRGTGGGIRSVLERHHIAETELDRRGDIEPLADEVAGELAP